MSATPPVDFQLWQVPGHLIRRTQQLHATIWSERIGDDLTSVQFAVLVALAQRPELDQRTLADSLSIDTSTLAAVCRRLADRGFIDRERHTSDARRYVLRVTPAGDEMVRRLIPAVRDVGDELLETLTEDEQATLMSLLQRVLEAKGGRDPLSVAPDSNRLVK